MDGASDLTFSVKVPHLWQLAYIPATSPYIHIVVSSSKKFVACFHLNRESYVICVFS